MGIWQRIKQLEKSLASEKKPVTFGIVYIGDGKGEEKAQKIKDEYFSAHGTYQGLTIVETYMPPPLQAPDDELLRQVWETDD